MTTHAALDRAPTEALFSLWRHGEIRRENNVLKIFDVKGLDAKSVAQFELQALREKVQPPLQPDAAIQPKKLRANLQAYMYTNGCAIKGKCSPAHFYYFDLGGRILKAVCPGTPDQCERILSTVYQPK